MGVRGKAISDEAKQMYLRLRGRGFSDKVCATLLGTNARTWRRIAERDPAFARDRDSAIRLGLGEVIETCQNWMIRAMDNDSKNAPAAYRQLMHIIRRNHPHLSKVLPSDDETRSGEKREKPAGDESVPKVTMMDFLGNLCDDAGPITKQVEARVLGLCNDGDDGAALAYADTSENVESG